MGLQVVRWVDEGEGAPEPVPALRPALLTVERAQALRQLRSELVRRQAEWRAEEERTRCGTGWSDVDALLGGGFLKGTVSSLAGGLGAGATTLAVRALTQVAERGELGAWVDADGTLCAAGLTSQGLPLDRLLWVRPPPEDVAWTAQQLARSGAFALVVVDWPASLPSSVVLSQRLAEAARAGGCAMVLLPGEGAAPAAFKSRLESAVDRPGLLRPVGAPQGLVPDSGVRRRARLWVERSRRGGEVSARVFLKPRRPALPPPVWRTDVTLAPARTGPDELWGELPVRSLVDAVHTRPRSRFRDGGQPVPTARVNPMLPELPSMRALRAEGKS